MGRRLPPLNALRAFEAAARHLSFKQAADELNVTPAAISQQIRFLEEYLGRKLFRRLPKGLALKPEAAPVVSMLTSAFDLLEQATGTLQADERARRVVISTPTLFAARWLVVRLADFQQTHPEVQVQLHAADQIADFAAKDLDLAVRFGRGGYEGFHAEKLFAAEFVPVCSPSLIARNGALAAARDLLDYPLLHQIPPDGVIEKPSWEDWFALNGVADLPPLAGPRLSNGSLMIDAAIAGQGIAVAASALVAPEIARGTLVRPYAGDAAVPQHYAYFLVHPEGETLSPAAEAFHAWLLAEARSATAQPAA